jgi:hypothetical protein
MDRTLIALMHRFSNDWPVAGVEEGVAADLGAVTVFAESDIRSSWDYLKLFGS